MESGESRGAAAPVEVMLEDPAWETAGVDWAALATRLHVLTLEALPDAFDGEAVILLSDDARLQELNRQFRGRDAPTNVLSFPALEESDALGDVALARETCAAEAAAQGKSFSDHAAHLILHGLLHLHGLDHEDGEAEAERMEAIERNILARIGVADPYGEDTDNE